MSMSAAAAAALAYLGLEPSFGSLVLLLHLKKEKFDAHFQRRGSKVWQLKLFFAPRPYFFDGWL